MKTKTFYITEDGKEKEYKFLKREFAMYKEICETIWGGLPYDLTWAYSTRIYQEKLAQFYGSNGKL